MSFDEFQFSYLVAVLFKQNELSHVLCTFSGLQLFSKRILARRYNIIRFDPMSQSVIDSAS